MRQRKESTTKKLLTDTKSTVRQPSDSRFIGSLAPSMMEALYNTKEVIFDVETTTLTPWDSPMAISKSAKIGGEWTVNRYCKEFGASLDARPRARILSLGTPFGAFVVDLDLLTSDERKELLLSALDSKIVVGHNVQFDLMWAQYICPELRPSRILDTMLLLRTVYPQGEVMLRKRVAENGFANPEDFAAAKNLIIAADKKGGGKNAQFGSLLAACLIVGLPAPDKSYQKPINWMPDVLTPGHYDYCAADATEPAIIARRLVTMAASQYSDDFSNTHDDFSHAQALRGAYDQMTTDRLLELLDNLPGGMAYKIAENAIPGLLQLQRNGLRMDPEASHQYMQEQQQAAEKIFEEKLSGIPEIAEMREDVLSLGESDALKNALDAAVGGRLPRTETGKPSMAADALTLSGLDTHPVMKAYSAIKDALKRRAMVGDYLAMTDSDSRIHPIVSILATTLRTTSQNPNLQNVPRDKAVRALYKAAPGNVMVAIDYSAVELRIAAALSARAYEQVSRMMESENPEDWGHMGWLRGEVLTRLQSDEQQAAPDPRKLAEINPTDDKTVSIDRWKAYYADSFTKVIKKVLKNNSVLTLRKAFRENVDPHLATALYLLSVRGEFDLQGKNPVDFLSGLSKNEQEELKDKYKSDRQSAKSCNFGLLYGMGYETLYAYGITNYGLSWSLEEAKFAYEAWHNLYPELGLWQLFTQLSGRFTDDFGSKQHTMSFAQNGFLEERTKKVFQGATLSGRPVVSYKITDTLNFQDQGSGAEIALAVLGGLPPYLLKRLVLFVHDEFIFEVPKEEAEQTIQEVEQYMIKMANWLLQKWGVPVEAEGAISDSWKH